MIGDKAGREAAERWWKTSYAKLKGCKPVGNGKSLKDFKKKMIRGAFWKHEKGQNWFATPQEGKTWTFRDPISGKHKWRAREGNVGALIPAITEASVPRGKLNSSRSLSYLRNTWALVASWKFPFSSHLTEEAWGSEEWIQLGVLSIRPCRSLKCWNLSLSVGK